DITGRSWSVTNADGTEVLSSTDSIATFTFGTELSVGDYTITLTVSNPECGALSTESVLRLSNQPAFTLVPAPDFCDTALVELVGVYENIPLIDSVRWNIFDTNNTLLFTSDSLAPAAAPFGVGTYYVTSEAFNGCGRFLLRDTFQVFAGPVLDIAADTTFVCLGDDPTVSILNESSGDSLRYAWEVAYLASGAGGFTVDDAMASRPTFSFQDTGRYVLFVTITNPVCDPVFWTDTILVSTVPEVTLDPIDDDCGEALITPRATYDNLVLLDSIRWLFPGAETATSTLADPGAIAYRSPGTYTVSVIVWNDCGSDTARQTFRVLEPIEIVASLDTTEACGVPTTIVASNTSTGDDLSFRWAVEGPFAGDVQFDDTLRSPTFTFPDTGVYVISLRVFNEICGEQFWRDTVSIFTAPRPVLIDQTDFCETVLLTPVPNYFSYRIDSVRWDFPGSDLATATSTERFPTDIPYSGAGDYVYSLTTYNRCGSHTVRDTFRIDTIPEVILGPTDTICIRDGVFQLPPALPPGGSWRDSLARPGVITADGLFDPEIAGGGLWTLEYVFMVRACTVVTQKQIFVVDLSFVAVDPPELDVCISDTTFILTNGMPGGGWYTGNGVVDSLGIFNASSVGVGSVTLTYFYQLPGTECIETRDFTVNVRPLPEPAIGVTDSICVNVPVDLVDLGANAVAWDWLVEDSIRHTGATVTHTFRDTGIQR
ncbi:MAG: hypothetical protein AAFN92_11620, partial [Bacteroidota bacterium]